MSVAVSVCIPTYCRPDLCRQAIDSVMSQWVDGLEVIVSDDSPDEATAEMIAKHPLCSRIRYLHNRPSLRQANNVNRLFDAAAGEYLILLHDDDLLLDSVIVSLLKCLRAHPEVVVAYGKQRVIDAAGQTRPDTTEELNIDYHRTADKVGIQASAEWSALVAQMPNDGYIIRRDVARSVRYNAGDSIGAACDYEFGLRLAATGGSFYFIDDFTCAYRMSPDSLTAVDYSHLTYDIIQQRAVAAENEPTKQTLLRRFAPGAVNCWLRHGRRDDARRIYFSRHYPGRRRFGVRGFVILLLLFAPRSLAARILRR